MSLQGPTSYYSPSQPQQFAGLPSLYSGGKPSSSASPATTSYEDSVYAASNSQFDQFTSRYTMPSDTTWGQDSSGGDGWYQSMQANLSGSIRPSSSPSNASTPVNTTNTQTSGSYTQNINDRALASGSWDDMAASVLVRQTVDVQNKPTPIDPAQSAGYQKLMAAAKAVQAKRSSVGFMTADAQNLAKQQIALEQAATRALIAEQIDKTIPAESQLGAMVRQIVSEALQNEPESPKFAQIMGQLTLLATKMPEQAALLDDVAMVVKDSTLLHSLKMLKNGQTGFFNGAGSTPRIEALNLERESLANRRAINQMLNTSNPAMNSLRGIVSEILGQNTIQASALDTLEARFKQAADREPLARAMAPKAYLLVLEIAVNQQLQALSGQGGADVVALKARKSLIADLYKQPNLTFDKLAEGMSKAPEYTAPQSNPFNMTQMLMMMVLAKKK